MSHDSGFRRGGKDFTHETRARKSRPYGGSRRHDEQLSKRFHQHERKLAEAQEAPAESEESEN